MSTKTKSTKKGELWKAFLAGIAGAIATGVVTYFTGIFGKMVDIYIVSDASAILRHLEVKPSNRGIKNTDKALHGNYVAECSPPDLLIGGLCELESHSDAQLQNMGISQDGKVFGCVYAGKDNDIATIGAYAACLHVKQ